MEERPEDESEMSPSNVYREMPYTYYRAPDGRWRVEKVDWRNPAVGVLVASYDSRRAAENVAGLLNTGRDA